MCRLPDSHSVLAFFWNIYKEYVALSTYDGVIRWSRLILFKHGAVVVCVHGVRACTKRDGFTPCISQVTLQAVFNGRSMETQSLKPVRKQTFHSDRACTKHRYFQVPGILELGET